MTGFLNYSTKQYDFDSEERGRREKEERLQESCSSDDLWVSLPRFEVVWPRFEVL